MDSKSQFQIWLSANTRLLCGVIGCGEIGSTVASTLMQQRLFDELILYDSNQCEASNAAQRLTQAAPFYPPVNIYPGDLETLTDCNLLVLCDDSAYTDPFFSLNERIKAFSTLITQLATHNHQAILLVAAEPTEIFTHIALEASCYPACRVLGIGTLAESIHLTALISNYFGIEQTNAHMFIVGEHGKHAVPLWSCANLSGMDLRHFCENCGRGDEQDVLDGLYREATESLSICEQPPYLTPYTAAACVAKISQAMLGDKQNTVLPLCVFANGTYGLENLCLSLPCVLNRHGVKQILEFPLTANEEALLHASAKCIQKEFVRFR